MDLTAITRELRDATDVLRFAAPVAAVYNPLVYAWSTHAALLRRFGSGRGRTLLVGMNPGPWGMAQTGVPFGAVSVARDWLALPPPRLAPLPEMHPRRPIEGFACTREEVSGTRLWGLARARWGAPEAFFAEFWVTNYCPLLFLDEVGRNLTPDKIRAADRRPLLEVCDGALRRIVAHLESPLVVGIGAWAETRARAACDGLGVPVGRILHPSPASPAANRGWAEQAVRELRGLGVSVPPRISPAESTSAASALEE